MRRSSGVHSQLCTRGSFRDPGRQGGASYRRRSTGPRGGLGTGRSHCSGALLWLVRGALGVPQLVLNWKQGQNFSDQVPAGGAHPGQLLKTAAWLPGSRTQGSWPAGLLAVDENWVSWAGPGLWSALHDSPAITVCLLRSRTRWALCGEAVRRRPEMGLRSSQGPAGGCAKVRGPSMTHGASVAHSVQKKVPEPPWQRTQGPLKSLQSHSRVPTKKWPLSLQEEYVLVLKKDILTEIRPSSPKSPFPSFQFVFHFYV